jgi:hypothetical protein
MFFSVHLPLQFALAKVFEVKGGKKFIEKIGKLKIVLMA